MSEEVREKEEKATLYGWAYAVGKVLFECLKMKHGGDEEQAIKKMKNIILNLRSELIPDKFRRELINVIIEITSDCEKSVGIREEVREERPWTVDEFYRYSTAILSGLYDAVFGIKRKSEGGR